MSTTEAERGSPAHSKDHIPALDGLRGIAVLLVLWEHLPRGVFGALEPHVYLRVQPGYLGVDIFFVLSGFLITRILLAERAAEHHVAHFLARRALRIFPIYYLALAAVWLVRPGPELPWCAVHLGNLWFALNPEATSWLAHTWSLSVEEHFYLLWPLLVFGTTPRWSRRIALFALIPLAIAAAIATNWWMRDQFVHARHVLQVGTPYRVLSLALGAGLAYGEPWIRARAARPLLLGALLLAVGYLVVLFPVPKDMLQWVPAPLRWSVGWLDFLWMPTAWLVGWSLFSTGVVLSALGLNELGPRASLALSNRALRGVGRISYGLYLYHLPLYAALGVKDYDGASIPIALVVGAPALSFAVATVSYFAIERPLLRLKDRFR